MIAERLPDGRDLLVAFSNGEEGVWICFIEGSEDNSVADYSIGDALSELFAKDGANVTTDYVAELAGHIEARREEATAIVPPENKAVIRLQARDPDSD